MAGINVGSFYHNVYFWLHEPDNAVHRKQFESALRTLLETSVNVKSYHIGIPASTDRPVVDRTYTYAGVMQFEDIAAHDAYQVEDAHLQFLAQNKHLWHKVVIFDSESI